MLPPMILDVLLLLVRLRHLLWGGLPMLGLVLGSCLRLGPLADPTIA